MIIDIFNETWKELECATKERGHPFSVCCFATVSEEGDVKQRNVNFRKLTSSKSLLFYTDSRSAKVSHLKKNPTASVLFYNPVINLQLYISGKVVVHTHNTLWENHMLKIEGKSINDYNTKSPPGKKIKNPVSVRRTKDLNFALLELQPNFIEYLKLKTDPNRVRAVFKKNDEEWEKTFLVP